MSRLYDCADPQQRREGIAAAARAAGDGDLVVLPTDTVYGIGANAFDAQAVAALLAAKGRGRDMPVPVLVGFWQTIDGLVFPVPDAARELIAAFWPGALSLVVRQVPSLMWDLGDSDGTVMLRMPLHPVAIELLREVGPMAVTSANRTGMPPASSVQQATEQLGDAVAVYLDGGLAAGGPASTILDCTGDEPVVLRVGPVTEAEVREVVTATRAAADQAAAVAAAAVALEQARLRKIAEREQAQRDRATDPRRRPGLAKKVAGARRRPSTGA